MAFGCSVRSVILQPHIQSYFKGECYLILMEILLLLLFVFLDYSLNGNFLFFILLILNWIMKILVLTTIKIITGLFQWLESLVKTCE